MRVLDLFAGLKGWSTPFEERGHEVFSIDLDTRFDVSLHADILEVTPADLPWQPDIILASPPCEAFSVMTIGRNWTLDHQPKTDKARLSVALVQATVDLITELRPSYFVIENPRAKLRKLLPLAGLERRTVTYCQYGAPYMKPTDLWGGFPPSLFLKPMCRPRSPCHVSAVRGSRVGVQGGGARWLHPALIAQSNNGHREDERERAQITRTKFRGGSIEEAGRMWSTSPERQAWTAQVAMIPAPLALDVCIAAEHDLAIGAMPMPLMLWSVS